MNPELCNLVAKILLEHKPKHPFKTEEEFDKYWKITSLRLRKHGFSEEAVSRFVWDKETNKPKVLSINETLRKEVI
jgi:hypothetical protein